MKDADYPLALYVVATPIGNLDDISLRAIETLRNVDVIACEDTRNSRVLLSKCKVSTSLISLHRYNENARIQTVIELLRNDQRVALISDAGTPNISDPGYRLVCSTREAGFRVIPVPGASSIIAALSVSGVDGSSFVFMGFSPKKRSALKEFFRRISLEQRTVIFLEPARRIMQSMDMARQLVPKRKFVLNRELTKKFEEIISGDAESIYSQLAQRENVKGEFVVVIEPCKLNIKPNMDEIVTELIEEGYSGKTLAKEAHGRYGVSKSEAYRFFLTIHEAKTDA
ncbi:MAG: 16S rRNA (cytidine(1402)-2'-O)-methyltransferase [Desulfomonilaceae bacterium]